MTITYTGQVANSRLGAFPRLLFYWKGSIYKLIYKEMVIFSVLYATLSLTYRFAMGEDGKRLFEKISLYCQTFTDLIPLAFILGFYVSIVVTRWWNQYISIPWPDRIMMYVATCLEGADELGKIYRRTLMRYLSLGSLIVLQATSVQVKKRFPTMEHLLEAGQITPMEVKALNAIHCPHGKWWVPFVWSCNLIRKARKEGRITDDYFMKCLIDEVMAYRGSLGLLYSYDWISVPLVYTQVTTLACYTFFVGCLVGRQFLEPNQGYQGHSVDLYVPVFTILQFFFYMGWLKVAEQLINPFGEDDDDFEVNWMIDRNMQISMLTVDTLYSALPALEKDMYFDESPPDFLPYTKSSIKTMIEPHIGSTADLSVSRDGMQVLNPMETIAEGVPLENPSYPYPNMLLGSPTTSMYRSRDMLHRNLIRSHDAMLSRGSLAASRGSVVGSDPCRGGMEKLDSRFTVLPVGEGVAGGKPRTRLVRKAPSLFMDHWLHEHASSSREPPMTLGQDRSASGTSLNKAESAPLGCSAPVPTVFQSHPVDEAGLGPAGSGPHLDVASLSQWTSRDSSIDAEAHEGKESLIFKLDMTSAGTSECPSNLQSPVFSSDGGVDAHTSHPAVYVERPESANSQSVGQHGVFAPDSATGGRTQTPDQAGHSHQQAVMSSIQPTSAGGLQTAEEENDLVPEVIVSPHTSSLERRSRHSSTNSSEASCDMYERPGASQSTVTSMTPLLTCIEVHCDARCDGKTNGAV